MKFLVLLSLGLVSLSACQNVPCRELKNQKREAQSQEGSAPTSIAGGPQLKVKVYKSDGSLQCGMGKKIPLETMEKELKGIQIFSKSNRNDGLMRIQVCGAPTGDANVYEIKKEDLEKAVKLGFKQWNQD